MASPSERIVLLIETTEKLLEQFEENNTAELKMAKRFALELREELEEVLESHDSDN